MKLIRKLLAKMNNAPFFVKKHWPQYYASCPEDLLNGRFKVIILNRSNVGDIVDFLIEGNYVFKYKVKKISFAQGGDWGCYSNKQFDLEYHSRYKANG